MRKFNVMQNTHLSADISAPIYRLVNVVKRSYYPSDLAADFYINEITDRQQEILLISLRAFTVDVKSKKDDTAYRFTVNNIGRDTKDYYLDCINGAKYVFSKRAYNISVNLTI